MKLVIISFLHSTQLGGYLSSNLLFEKVNQSAVVTSFNFTIIDVTVDISILLLLLLLPLLLLLTLLLSVKLRFDQKKFQNS